MNQQNELTISLFQMDYEPGGCEANLEKVRRAAAEAAAAGASILLLPELWYSGYVLERSSEIAAPLGERQFARTAETARENGIYLAGSMLCLNDWGQVVNRAVIYGPDGELVGYYDKMHLFPKLKEDRHLTAGNRLPVFELPWGPTALAVCYDLRFPELFRRYALFEGARLVLVPSAWPEPRLRFARLMSLARACENQCWLATCNRSGASQRGRPLYGQSLVADPWGDPLVEAGREEQLLTATLDMSAIERSRAQLDLRHDLRWDFFYPGREDERRD